MTATDKLVIKIERVLTPRMIALVLLYSIEDFDITDLLELPDAICASYKDTDTVNKKTSEIFAEAGDQSLDEDFIRHWFVSQYSADTEVFNKILDIVEDYIKELRVL